MFWTKMGSMLRWRIWRFIRTAPILYSGLPTFLRNGFYLVNSAINALREITIRLGIRHSYKGPRYG